MSAPDVEREIRDLARRFGEPVRRTAAINDAQFWAEKNRDGEVCMVICRPNGLLLTITKPFYPPQTYRLPTGGVERGESIFDALLREVGEETGLQVEVERFLAVVGYVGAEEPDHAPGFRTYAFLLRETGGILGATDPDEQVSGYQEIAPFELPALAIHLGALPQTEADAAGGTWEQWGRFRAVMHQVVYEILSSSTCETS